jgi:hypothetical protein
MKPRHAAALALLPILLVGCALSAETTGGQISQIKSTMTREEVIGTLGEPAKTDLADSEPSKDRYSCDEHGQIMVLRKSMVVTVAEVLFVPLAVADLVKNRDLANRSRVCVVNYDQGRVVSTSMSDDIILSK